MLLAQPGSMPNTMSHLSYDHPLSFNQHCLQADFSFFFDTGGRRRCYLAPERFYEAQSAAAAGGPVALTPAMDVFSLGCVLAELFTDGAALFDLSQVPSQPPNPKLTSDYPHVRLPCIRSQSLHRPQADLGACAAAAGVLCDCPVTPGQCTSTLR
jgi:serine/threonine protein kinase